MGKYSILTKTNLIEEGKKRNIGLSMKMLKSEMIEKLENADQKKAPIRKADSGCKREPTRG